MAKKCLHFSLVNNAIIHGSSNHVRICRIRKTAHYPVPDHKTTSPSPFFSIRYYRRSRSSLNRSSHIFEERPDGNDDGIDERDNEMGDFWRYEGWRRKIHFARRSRTLKTYFKLSILYERSFDLCMIALSTNEAYTHPMIEISHHRNIPSIRHHRIRGRHHCLHRWCFPAIIRNTHHRTPQPKPSLINLTSPSHLRLSLTFLGDNPRPIPLKPTVSNTKIPRIDSPTSSGEL